MNALTVLYVYLKNWFEPEEGQDLIEYALIIGLFVIAAVASIVALNAPLQALWTSIGTQLKVTAP